MLSRPKHFANTSPSMLVTLLGMLMLVICAQYFKELSPRVVTVLGITVALHPRTSVSVLVSMIALQLFRLSNFGFLLSTVIRERLKQSVNES